MDKFNLKSSYKPAGDQPGAIKQLVDGLESGLDHQTLLGVTGSGKTFTAANVIASVNRPTLVIAHNKTLAAQLAAEYQEFFPDNAVHYFVSYYDFYQPEAYLPVTDTYIEKDAQVNQEIERLRHASTQALLTRRDVIIVASVSCIYGLGSPEQYRSEHLELKAGQKLLRNDLLRNLVSIFYERTNADLTPGTFRGVGNTVEVMPPGETEIYHLTLDSGVLERIDRLDAITREIIETVDHFFLFPGKHFMTTEAAREKAIVRIQDELKDQLAKFEGAGKLLEADRLRRRTNYDVAMLREIGFCTGIENYSRHLSGRGEGEAPDTLLSYFPEDFLTIIDESHVTVPQVRGMHAGDQSRKKTLVEHGFRLPSALDNRPLQFPEFQERIGQVIYTSATPGPYELEHSGNNIAQQIVRPTGLLDPVLEVRPVVEKGPYKGQIQDLIAEIEEEINGDNRVIATTLTKKMAEDLSTYLKEKKIKAEYLHSEVKTLERIKILTEFRKGVFDVLVGVNLLREGLDLPEVTLIGILDADKEGFLRSETSLIQTIGRAARNENGRVILYADQMTGSLDRAITETKRRRELQMNYNKEHGITPKTINKNIKDITEELEKDRARTAGILASVEAPLALKGHSELRELIKQKETQMNEAVKKLAFEEAAILRDEIKLLRERLTKNTSQKNTRSGK